MQISSSGDNLHELSNPIFCEKNIKEKIFEICRLLIFFLLPSMLSVKTDV